MENPFTFSQSTFNRLFPFYILINREMKVIGMGKSIQKLLKSESFEKFNQAFSIPRPLTPINSFDDLIAIQNQLVVLKANSEKNIIIRGQFEYFSHSQEILFIGSPWFESMEQVIENNLLIDDFAHHDPLIDLLHVLKTQEITTTDLKELVSTINKQKNDLKKASKEVQEIALFPTQSPDPLIRINFNGDVLRNNPAAAKLDFFEFEKKIYRNDEFFVLIAERIDKNEKRWTIEAKSDDKDYSFLCVPMAQEEYINIYGRDITSQKQAQIQLERLSLVASANENGVAFANAKGQITWANEGFCKLTGYDLSEIIGQLPTVLFRGPLSDQNTLNDILQSFYKGQGFNSEIIYYRKDQTWFWGRTVSQPIRNTEGEIIEYFGIVQNITEEKTIQEKLKVLSQIAEDNINGVVIADAKGKITWVNKSFTEMTGYSLDECIGQKPGALLQGAETDKSTVNYLSTQIKKGDPFNTEIINYSKTGRKYWLRIQGQPIKNEKDELIGYFALEEDITKEKESESRFRKALENIGDNVWEHDFKTNQTYFSKSDDDFLGYSENNNPKEQWWSSVYHEDLHLLIENNEKYLQAKADSHNLEYRIIHKNGSIKWVLDRGVVIERDQNGKPLRVTGTHTDITSRKEFEQTLRANEEKYRGIIANMNLGLMELAPDQSIVFANQSLIQMTGLSDEEIIGYDASKFIAEASKEEVNKRMLNRKKGISEAYEVKINIGGINQWWLVSSAPKLSAVGEYFGSVVICLDITKQKNLERDLIKSREHAEQLAKTKETFLANMSHEIRTPMNAIMGMSNQLAKTSMSEQQNFYLSTINTASENLLVIINDILDLSKIEAGKLSVEKIGFEPKKVIANAMQVLMHKAEEKGLILSNSFCDVNLAPILMGDPYRLNQVLLNLISNAIKFTENGFVDIQCEVLKDTNDSQTLRAKVIDTGVGMEKEFVDKLFDKFSQEYESVSRRYGGTGLGMSISIELMGGSLSVESEKGKGSIISFEIELSKGSEADLPRTEAENISPDFLKNRCILVADDNEMNRLVASTILDLHGATVVEASNGEEALRAIEKQNIDLVLMDIQMPILNGYESSKLIRQSGIKIPIIALTANAIKGENLKCIEVGMNDYLAKPYKEDEFLKKIAYWLNTVVISKEAKSIISANKGLYDLSALKDISRGNEEFIEKMIRLFCQQTPSLVRQIKEAYQSDKLYEMGSIAHKLKPSIDNLKIESLKQVIRNIEKAGKENSNMEELADWIELVEEITNKIIQKMKQEFPDL